MLAQVGHRVEHLPAAQWRRYLRSTRYVAHGSEIACALGAIIVNLQALELGLRLFIGDREDLPAIGEIIEGAWLKDTPFTSWDTLGKLIEKYNSMVAAAHPVGLCSCSRGRAAIEEQCPKCAR
jgi:hypothetical protein